MKIILPPLLILLSILYIVLQTNDLLLALFMQLSLILYDSALLLIPHVFFLGGSHHTRLNLLRVKIISILIGNIILVLCCFTYYPYLLLASPLTILSLLSSFLKPSKLKRIFLEII